MGTSLNIGRCHSKIDIYMADNMADPSQNTNYTPISTEVVVLTQVRVTINHLHNITIARGRLHLGRTKAELTPPKAHSKTHWVIPWPPRGVLLPEKK